jgi:hypothetical protein
MSGTALLVSTSITFAKGGGGGAGGAGGAPPAGDVVWIAIGSFGDECCGPSQGPRNQWQQKPVIYG